MLKETSSNNDFEYQTTRFKFFKLTVADGELFSELYGNDIVMGKIMPKLSGSQAKALLQEILLRQHKNTPEFWRIECKQTKQTLGIQGFMASKSQRNEQDAEFGILLKPANFGKNIATESVTAMLFFGFTKLNLITAHAFFKTENIAIMKIAQRLKFTIETVTDPSEQTRCDISRTDFIHFNEDASFVI